MPRAPTAIGKTTRTMLSRSLDSTTRLTTYRRKRTKLTARTGSLRSPGAVGLRRIRRSARPRVAAGLRSRAGADQAAWIGARWGRGGGMRARSCRSTKIRHAPSSKFVARISPSSRRGCSSSRRGGGAYDGIKCARHGQGSPPGGCVPLWCDRIVHGGLGIAAATDDAGGWFDSGSPPPRSFLPAMEEEPGRCRARSSKPPEPPKQGLDGSTPSLLRQTFRGGSVHGLYCGPVHGR
jgi:hypothetical protein